MLEEGVIRTWDGVGSYCNCNCNYNSAVWPVDTVVVLYCVVFVRSLRGNVTSNKYLNRYKYTNYLTISDNIMDSENYYWIHFEYSKISNQATSE